jgi:hypothetical protein
VVVLAGVCCNITAAPQDQYNNTIKDDVQLQGLRLLHGIPPAADQVSLDPVMGLNYTIRSGMAGAGIAGPAELK